MRKAVELALRRGFQHAYERVAIEPDRYLVQLQVAYGLPVSSYDGLSSVPIERLDDVANDVIRSGMKIAAAEGVGLGFGGLFTVLPDLGILAAITLRTIQKLSLVYGFEFTTEAETAELWIAAATAAGVDVSRELLEKNVMAPLVPRLIRASALQASSEVVEKWAGRLVPILSSAVGGSLNYYFVRSWGERAMRHFREKHMLLRQQNSRPHVVAEYPQPPHLPESS